MSHRPPIDDFLPRRDDLRGERSLVVILAISALLFVDIQLPVIGSSNRLLAVLVLPLLLFGRSHISTPFCAAAAFLLPVYFLVPPLIHQDVDAHDFITVFVFQMTAVGAMVLLARVLAHEDQRRKLTDALILFAIGSAMIATLQRYGALEPLGRDRWGHAVTVSDSLRGAGFLADPNFLAAALASVIPLALNWRFRRVRWLAVVVLGVGVNATDSRMGILLTVLALVLSVTAGMGSRRDSVNSNRQKAVVVIAACLIALFAFNVGGQRDRVVEGVLIGVGVHDVATTADAIAGGTAHSRRQAVLEWIDVGLNGLPFGVGIGADDGFATRSSTGLVAHNSYVSAFAEGGVAGLLLDVTVLLCVACFIRRRTEPFAIMGIILAASGLFLTYGLCMIVPLGLADGIRAAGLGIRERRGDAVHVPDSQTDLQPRSESTTQL
ncbi:O-antigen ligase family protein [Mycobacterium sp. NPDC048908]|uniref:O-antigen ligase family protein n=1 Tax=Mycobacterium sp. NPDC048908 TaxID=3364292 RepID=UPI00371AFA52